MAGQDAEVAVPARYDDHVHRLRDEQTLGRHEFEIDLALGHWRAFLLAVRVRRPRRPSCAPSLRPVRWFPPCRRSEEHTSELQSLMRISYAVFCLKKKNNT